MNKKDVFASDAVLAAATAISALGFLFVTVMSVAGKGSNAFYAMLAFLFIIITFVSYKKHEKNVMKCVIGAFLTWNMLYIRQAIDLNVRGLLLEPSIAPFIYLVELLLAIALFLNHLVINSDHHSSPASVRLNKVMLLIVMALWLVYIFVEADGAADAVMKIALIASSVVVISIESKLDAFRMDRESKGWTEKK